MMMSSEEERLYERLYIKEEELRQSRWDVEDRDIFIEELVRENELLKAQVYNLSLYLQTLWKNTQTKEFLRIAEDYYDGMPGWVGLKAEVLEQEDTV